MHSLRSHFVVIIVSIFCQPVGMHSPRSDCFCHYYCIYFLSASRNVFTALTLCCYYRIYFCQPVGMHSSCSNCFVIITVSIFCQPVGMHSPHSHFVVIIVSIFCQPEGMHSPCSHCFVVITVSIFCQQVGMRSPRSRCFVVITVSIFCQPVAMHSCHILPNMGVHSHRHALHSHCWHQLQPSLASLCFHADS